VEWAVFNAPSMLEYHDIERGPQAIVRVVRIMARCRDGS
jgi:hypothetical protein